ncbi:hypothetical protein QMK19_03375 [Streptomyces sp. H10-C2]|uniref:hypothetical protein n=1 Tax=unclassified Streptomyces TaxID=2593676 RepID=UPI0024BBDF83|nr:MULTISPECIES: hypothetical protein [unclassified Streptomyces]MDJ0342227.1 hypothetical protein [Streptomyces sp. PH10-H1]MDJ0368741.1 hypothetical protein [Streptomyces sp. H10-C2]
MPNVPKTPISRFRIDPEEWRDFKHAVGTRDRSVVIRDFIAWYLRRPNAKAIKRPEVDEWLAAANAEREAEAAQKRNASS